MQLAARRGQGRIWEVSPHSCRRGEEREEREQRVAGREVEGVYCRRVGRRRGVEGLATWPLWVGGTSTILSLLWISMSNAPPFLEPF